MRTSSVSKWMNTRVINQTLQHLVDYSELLTVLDKDSQRFSDNARYGLAKNQLENCIKALKEELK